MNYAGNILMCNNLGLVEKPKDAVLYKISLCSSWSYCDKLNHVHSPQHHGITLCGFAVALNKSLIGPEHKQFQQKVEQEYKALKSRIQACILSKNIFS